MSLSSHCYTAVYTAVYTVYQISVRVDSCVDSVDRFAPWSGQGWGVSVCGQTGAAYRQTSSLEWQQLCLLCLQFTAVFVFYSSRAGVGGFNIKTL